MSDSIRKRRDAKTIPHLRQYAPVWLESESLTRNKDTVIFNVVFQHPTYGWVSRRYQYDSFNDVLYHQGQRTLDEQEALSAIAAAPYVDAIQSTVRNSYGG
jgi:hypothetical protein